MASSFKNTIINDTGHLTVPSGTSNQRLNATVIRWTNTGSQAYSVITGTTPTLSNSSWTCPAGVTQIELLVVAGGGGGGFNGGGGGGAGGLIYSPAYPVTAGSAYTVSVGQGGAGSGASVTIGTPGSDSSFNNIVALGGGGGNSRSVSGSMIAGGSGGGGSGATSVTSQAFGFGTAGTGNPGGLGTTPDLGLSASGEVAAVLVQKVLMELLKLQEQVAKVYNLIFQEH
jgi:hypothetical protein